MLRKNNGIHQKNNNNNDNDINNINNNNKVNSINSNKDMNSYNMSVYTTSFDTKSTGSSILNAIVNNKNSNNNETTISSSVFPNLTNLNNINNNSENNNNNLSSSCRGGVDDSFNNKNNNNDNNNINNKNTNNINKSINITKTIKGEITNRYENNNKNNNNNINNNNYANDNYYFNDKYNSNITRHQEIHRNSDKDGGDVGERVVGGRLNELSRGFSSEIPGSLPGELGTADPYKATSEIRVSDGGVSCQDSPPTHFTPSLVSTPIRAPKNHFKPFSESKLSTYKLNWDHINNALNTNLCYLLKMQSTSSHYPKYPYSSTNLSNNLPSIHPTPNEDEPLDFSMDKSFDSSFSSSFVPLKDEDNENIHPSSVILPHPIHSSVIPPSHPIHPSHPIPLTSNIPPDQPKQNEVNVALDQKLDDKTFSPLTKNIKKEERKLKRQLSNEKKTCKKSKKETPTSTELTHTKPPSPKTTNDDNLSTPMCLYCSRTFRYKSSCRRHMKLHEVSVHFYLFFY